MTAQVRLHCLGSPAVYLPDGSVLRFRVRKHLALLVFLAMEPRTHRRDRLAELLWPGVSGREGRHSLATALSVLRARVGRNVIEAGRDSVRLIPGTVELDLDRLAAGDVLGSDIVPPLAVAPLLEEFDIADAPEWGQWRDGQAARWQPAIRDALLALIDRSRRHGDTRAMERLADSLLAIDALSEEGIRSKMEARAFAGDRLSALKIFEEWKARLADEVGAQPGELVEGMAVRLRRRGWERTGQSHIASVHTDQWKGRPFVGRGREYRQLYEGWEGCQRRAPRHVILTGDSGVGKSTLAERLTTAAGLQGAVSGREQCHEVERDVPYAAMGGLAVGLLDKPGATAIAPEWLGELGRVVSEVKRRFPHAPPPLEAEGETVRIRIADAFAELAIAVAEEQPLVLVLDDLHLADDASVAVLHHLLRRVEEHRILVILTARPGEIAREGNAQRLLERSEHVGLVTVAVPPLTAGESEELLESLVTARTAGPPGPATRRALLQAAAGYPMVLELLVDDWQAHGDGCLALTLGGMTERAATQNPGEMYGRLLDRLSGALAPTGRNVLNLASVLGSRLNDFSLYALVDLTLAETMTGLSQLTSMRILRDAGEGLEFINELMRAQAYLTVPSPVRRVLHSKVADLLIARADGGEGMLRLEIAWHCIRAGRKEESARYLIAGADEAIEQGAHVDAERALITAIPNLEPEVKPEAQYRLALILQDQGRWEESVQAIEGVTTANLQANVLALRVAASALVGARSGTPRSDIVGALADALDGSAGVSVKLRVAAAAASYGVLSYDHSVLPRISPTLDRLDQKVTSPAERAALLVSRAQFVWPYRRYDETMRLLQAAGEIISALPHWSPLRIQIHLGLAMTLAATARYRQALAEANNAFSGALRIGNEATARTASVVSAQCYLRLGNAPATISSTERLGRFDVSKLPLSQAISALHQRSLALIELQQLKEAMALIRLGDELTNGRDASWLGAAWHLWSAEPILCAGEHRAALLRAEAGVAAATASSPNVGIAGAYCRWVSVLHDNGFRMANTTSEFRRHVTEIQYRDTLDQTEIALAAHATFGREVLTQEQIARVRPFLQHTLPASTVTLLQALGLRWPET